MLNYFNKWLWTSENKAKKKTIKPNYFNTYYEPFIGGGAVWLHLNNTNSVVGDNFVELINLYQSVKTHKEKIIDFINNENFLFMIRVFDQI